MVPGCGRGYDAIAFGKSGYDSTGLDLSPTGVEQAKALLAEQKGEEMSGKVKKMCNMQSYIRFMVEGVSGVSGRRRGGRRP